MVFGMELTTADRDGLYAIILSKFERGILLAIVSSTKLTVITSHVAPPAVEASMADLESMNRT